MARTNKDRSEATRAALMQAARTLFVGRGYAETGTPELVAAAGVTRGALYHHFADKQALFRAVVEAEAAAVAAAVEAATPDGLSPLQALKQGGAAFLDAMAQPGRTRLLLVEAPAVLGDEAVASIDEENGARTLREGLEEAMQAGAIRRLPLAPLAGLLSAAFDRAARAVAAGESRRSWLAALDGLVDGLAVKEG